jgi:D-alanyl-D-alanine carboxypeptidase
MVSHPHTQTVIFSIIVNGNSLGQAVARTVIDQIVEALVELRDC